MKKWKKSWKKMLALLLVMVLAVPVLYAMSKADVWATTINADLSSEGKITNSDFESGRDGYEVRGWHLTSMQMTCDKYTGTYDYLQNFIFETRSEGDNKVAHLQKKGSGTAAMTSEEIEVVGGKTYRLSADYKMKDFSIDINPSTGEEYTTNNNFRGIRFMIEQFDENGNSLSYSKYPTAGNIVERESVGWNTYFTEFTTSVNAKTIVVYCNLGGDMRVKSTALFDNITIERIDNYSVFNSTFEKTSYAEEGSKAAGIAGPSGWTLVRTNDGGSLTPSHNNKWEKNFRATTKTVDGSKVAAIEYLKERSTAGYVLLQSQLIPLNGEQTCNVTADCKLVCYNADGSVKVDGYLHRGINLNLACYDANGNFLGNTMGEQIKNTQNSKQDGVEWKQLRNTGVKTLAGTKYVKIGLYVGYALSDANKGRNPEGHFNVYFDNVSLDVESALTGWTLETCGPKGVPRGDDLDFTPYYGIRKINGGTGKEDALQLYVKRDDGPKGGAVMYSSPVQIAEDKKHTVAFDLKIEDYVAEEDTNSNRIFGAVGVLRYLDSEGKQINGTKPEICRSGKENIDWTHYEYTFTPPEGAVAVQFGLVMGTNKIGICKNMKYSLDHVVIMEKEAYEDSQKNPEVTSSVLYKQNALFVGDATGSALAERALNFSQMKVKDACSESKSAVSKLIANADSTYDYIIISGGEKEKEADMPAGTVTRDTLYMEGMNFDETKFAGTMEQLFGTVAEYYDSVKIVYVLTTEDKAYQDIAKKATEKWGVQLVMLEESSNDKEYWEQVIEPAEYTDEFEPFNIPDLFRYLDKKVDALIGDKISVDSDMESLQRIRKKAQKCPESHKDYEDYQNLIQKINENLAKFADFRPLICGGTVSTIDPNQLYFIGMAPKNQLSEGTTVKQMGILSMPASYLNAGEELKLDNPYVNNMQAIYTEATKEFYVHRSSWDVDPAMEYVATAYIIYEIDGEEYVFYSNNNYKNVLGTTTAVNGRITKSVYQIAKSVALQLSDAKANDLNFDAIGGAENIPQIGTATEESTITLLDVWRFVGDNKEVLKKWLDEGGTSR